VNGGAPHEREQPRRPRRRPSCDLPACGRSVQLRRQSGHRRSELALVSFSEEEEAALGAKAYTPAVQQQGGFYRDPALEEYVQSVGMRLARVSHRPNLDYRYRVLNSSVPNAFALPGGFIVINGGSWWGFQARRRWQRCWDTKRAT